VTSFLIWGAGGHGRVVADLVRALGHRVYGFVDGNPSLIGEQVDPGGACVEIREDDFLAVLANRGGGDQPFDAIALGIGNNGTRLGRMELLHSREVPPLAHPAAVVSAGARLGRGTVVFAGAVVNSGARIGEAAIVNTGAIIEHDCVVGDGVHVSPGAVLSGGVSVGERAWVGAGSVVIQGIAIGADSIVGAGAVVIHDVPDGATVVGNPARIIRQRG